MVAYWYGVKPGGVPALKITKANLSADAILALPTTSYQAFLFDSEQSKLGYVYDISQKPYGTITWTTSTSSNPEYQFICLPPGTTPTTAKEIVQARIGKGGNFGYFVEETHSIMVGQAFPDLPFTPIIEVRRQEYGSSRLPGPTSRYINLGSSGISEVGEIRGSPGYTGRSSAAIAPWDSRTGDFTTYYLENVSYTIADVADHGAQKAIISVWELPAKNQPIPTYAGTPVPSHLALRLSPSMVRLAYAGHQVSENVPHIFSESRIPAKVLAAGEVTIAAGASVTVPTRLPTTPATYVDYHARLVDTPMYHPPLLPGSAKSDSINISFEVLAQGVAIYNDGPYTMVVRYMVLADDDSAPSSGGSMWQRKGTDAVGDYWQIKRPGSSDSSPQLNDIIVDTRLAYLPLVDEGYLSAADFTEATDSLWLGNARKTVTFANDGFLPFVKYVTVFDDHYEIPQNRGFKQYFINTGWGDRSAGDSVNCLVGADFLRFYMSPANPTSIKLFSNGDLTIEHGQKPIGIRWYLFAIPTSL